MSEPTLPRIGKVGSNNQLTIWYTFKSENIEPSTKKSASFAMDFGLDGNAYVTDM